MDSSTDSAVTRQPSPASRQPRASNASRASSTSNSTTGRNTRSHRQSDNSPGRRSGTVPATPGTAGSRRASRSSRPTSPATGRGQDGTAGRRNHGQQAANVRQRMAADSDASLADGVRAVLDAPEGAMLRYTLAVVRLLLMAVGSYIIAWTGHLVHGLIVEFNGLPGIATMLMIIMVGCILAEFLQAAWLVFALRPRWRPSNACGLGISLKPYTWELSTDLLFAGIWGAMVGSIFLRGHYTKYNDVNKPYVAAGSCAIGLQLICVALVIRLRVVLTVLAAKKSQPQAHASVTVQRGPRSAAAKYGLQGAPNAANMV